MTTKTRATEPPSLDSTKACRVCGVEKTRDRRHSICRPCANARLRAWKLATGWTRNRRWPAGGEA